MSKRFCLHGHDTEVVGRNASRTCRECNRAYQQAWQQQARATDSEYLERQRRWCRERNRKRYATDPEWRERHLEQCRVWYHTTARGQSSNERALLRKEGRL